MKRIFLTLAFAVVAAFSFTGCTSLQAKFDTQVQAATVPDVTAALSDAQAAADADGAACWADVLAYINALPTTVPAGSTPTINGVASAIEAARTVQLQPLATIPPISPQLHKDCAVVILDAQQTAAKLGLSAAALGKGVGAVKVLKAAGAQ